MTYNKIPLTISFKQAVKEKDYFAGTSNKQTIKSWHCKESWQLIFGNIEYVPKYFKMFDEVLVNAIDHHFDMLAQRGENMKVTSIGISVIGNTITISNDGMGFYLKSLDILKNALLMQHCSSNHNNPNSMTGGINGLGLKIVTHNTTSFKLITHDNISNLSAMITISNGELVECKYVEGEHTGTTISFDINIDNNMIMLIRRRVLETLLFINSISMPITITYNGAAIEYDLDSYVKSFANDYVIINTETHNNKIALVFAYAKMKRNFISILNGMSVMKCGFHDKIRKYVYAQLFKICGKIVGLDNKKTRRSLNTNMFIIVIRRAYHSCYGLESQTKEKISVTCDKCIDFSFDCKSIFNIFMDIFKSDRLHNTKLQLYEKARKAGTRDSDKCYLFIIEGNSAYATMLNIINSELFPIDRQYCGLLSITGVPKNIVKKLDIIRDGETQRVRFTDGKPEPKGIHDIVVAMGLDYNKTYISSRHTLNYGKIVLSCDQDLDGIGNIASLIISAIGYIWPSLIDMIMRINSPILTVHMNNNEPRFLMDEDDEISNAKTILYHKGLGHLGEKEIDYISKYALDICTKYIDDKDNTIITQYYESENSDIRRNLLKRGHINVGNRLKMSINEHINDYGIKFNLYKNQRQIPNYIDGMNVGMRKLLYIALGLKAGKYKVNTIAGYMLSDACYAHGDPSSMIICSAQWWQGTRTIPFFKTISMGIGSITTKRKEHSQARYIEVHTNDILNTIFPKIDEAFLTYKMEEGKKCEPETYYPIVPIILLEIYRTPGFGWKCESIPRSLFAIITKIRARLNGEHDDVNLDHYSIKYPNTTHFINNKTLKVYGKYIYEEDKITIIGLPIQVWVNEYILKIKKSDWYNEYFNGDPVNMTSKDNNIKIILYIDKKARDTISRLHEEGALYNLLELYKSYKYDLNFIDNNNIREFTSYNDIFDEWFAKRKHIYELRYNYILEHLSKDINKYTNIIRFLTTDFGNIKLKNVNKLGRIHIYRELGYASDSYQYLDDLKVKHAGEEGISKYTNKLDNINRQYKLHCAKSWATLWNDDLDIFIRKYIEYSGNMWAHKYS